MIVNVNSIVQLMNNETCQCECKYCCACKKDYSWNPSTCICENGKFLKSIANNSIIACDEIINAADSVSTIVTKTILTNMTNTISTNAASTASINSDDKIFIIAIICYHYAKYR